MTPSPPALGAYSTLAFILIGQLVQPCPYRRLGPFIFRFLRSLLPDSAAVGMRHRVLLFVAFAFKVSAICPARS